MARILQTAIIGSWEAGRPLPAGGRWGLALAGPALAAVFVVHTAAGQPDSSTAGETFWLPLPVEEIETPEELDARQTGGAGVSLHAATSDSGLQLRRASATCEGRSLRAQASVLGGMKPRDAFAVALSSPGSGLTIVAGRVAVRAAGSTFAEALQLSRRTSRIPSTRAEIPALDASAGISSPAMEAFGVRWRSRSERALDGAWAVAGRAIGSGTPVSAGGLLAATRWGALSVGAGAFGDAPAVAASIEWRSHRASLASEVTVARRGVASILSVEGGGPAFRARGRWRYRAWDARPVACELSAESGARWARGRIRVLQGPSGETGTVGRVELEARVAAAGAGPVSIRAGRSKTEGFSAAEGATLRGQRYAVLDATVARAGGRTISILASRRESEIAVAGRAGSSLGARLDLTWRRRARLEILVEASRVGVAGVGAWESGFHAGGSTSLRSRTVSGVSASARGVVSAGAWSLGGVVEGREDVLGRRTAAATIWIQKAIRVAAPKPATRAEVSTDGGD